MKTHRKLLAVGTMALCLGAVACESDYSESNGDRQVEHHRDNTMHEDADVAIRQFKDKDPSLTKFFDTAYAYAIFPNIGKGGAGIGGAYGKGEVYQNGHKIGHVTLGQATVGAQLGGQSYSEIIFFQNQSKLDDLMANRVEFAAQASAVAATSGAAKSADYSSGVAVFILPRGGLMGEASVGGQKFTYHPNNGEEREYHETHETNQSR